MNKLMERSSVKGRLLVVTNSEAAALRLPVGHPRSKVVYVGHPIDPVTYIPMAHFHTFLFEHKVAEALRLMRSLGADSVDVIRVEGWDRSAGTGSHWQRRLVPSKSRSALVPASSAVKVTP